MIPLPGSWAICSLSPSNNTGQDQRGNPRVTTYGATTCQDAGAVQTNYAISFTTEPPASVSAGFNFSAEVTLDESGSVFTADNQALPLTLTGTGTLSNNSVSLANGVATYNSLQVSLPGTGDALTAGLTLNPNITPTALSISATSSTFNVIASSTTTTASNATATYSANAQSITLTANVTSAGGTVNAGTITFAVLNGSTPIGTVVTSTTVANGAASVSYTLPAGTAAGTYTIQAVYNAGGAFTTSSDTTHSLTIQKATATVALHSLSQTYTGASLAATATTTPAGLTVTFTYTGTGGTTYATSATAPTAAGSYTVVATVNDPNYTGTATGTLVIGQATPSITWTTPAAITYGTALSATQLDATSPVAGSFAYTPASGAMLTAGPHTLSVTFTPTDTTDYTTATTTVQITVSQATPSITWATPAAITYGTALSATQLNATSPVAGTFAYTPASGATLTAGAHTLSVTFTPTDTTDYTTATSTIQLTVNQATQTINFAAPTSPVNYGVAPIVLAATGGASGNPVIFSIVSGPGTLSGSTLTITGTGTVVIAANQAGNANYVAAPQVTQPVVVNAAAQTISFATGTLAYASGVTYGTTPLTLSATSNSGLAVSFSLISGPATLSGSTLIISGAGTVVIAANQPGNSDYAAAPQVTESIPVNRALPIAAIASSVNPVLLNNGITFTATVTSGAGTPSGTVTFLDGSTALGTGTLSAGVATFTTSSLAVGTHTITVAYGGDQNFLAATSSPITELVQDFSFNISTTTSSTTVTALPGGTAVFNFTATPSGGTTFPANIVLSVSGLPAGATYSFTPTMLTAGEGATQVTLTINLPQTQASTGLVHQNLRLASNHQNVPQPTVARRMAPFALALILLPFAGRLRRAGRRMSRMLSILLLMVAGMAAVAGLSGCGSTNGFFAQQQQSYTVTITGTAGALSHSTTVTLIVE
jgi:hypothetical protein